jgi:hypothetical protein
MRLFPQPAKFSHLRCEGSEMLLGGCDDDSGINRREDCLHNWVQHIDKNPVGSSKGEIHGQVL